MASSLVSVKANTYTPTDTCNSPRKVAPKGPDHSSRFFAAGDIGTETMQLRVRGAVVQTWNNVGGNPSARQFQTFEHRAADTVLPDDIQVAFTNDNFAFGTPDRNLNVDHITIDGLKYETEVPTVFSTGT